MEKLRKLVRQFLAEGLDINEMNLSSDELNKRSLPMKYPQALKFFVANKKDAITDIIPGMNMDDATKYPLSFVNLMKTDYPSLYDEFADFIYMNKKEQTTFN